MEVPIHTVKPAKLYRAGDRAQEENQTTALLIKELALSRVE